jgi:hypothetical protein
MYVGKAVRFETNSLENWKVGAFAVRALLIRAQTVSSLGLGPEITIEMGTSVCFMTESRQADPAK